VSAQEFDIILSEFQHYNFLKERVRSKLIREPSNVDVGKLEKDICGKVEAKFRKRNNQPRRFKTWGVICIS